MPEKYKIPTSVKNNAKRALEIRKTLPPSQRGLTAVGVARAVQLRDNGYVYCLRFRSTQFYVGSSNNPVKRFGEHKTSCFSKKPTNSYLSRCWKKFGEPELYILAKVPLNLMLEEEQKFIDLVFKKQGCLNLNPKADRPPSRKGTKLSAEAKAKLIAANKGKKCSAETKAKLSAILKGRPSNWLGKKHKPETIAKMRASQKGKVVSDETAEKIKATLKAKILPEEERIKMSTAGKENRAKWPNGSNCRRAVIGIKGDETIQFRSVRQAAEFIGRDHKGIVRAIKGDGQTTCAGYTWMYK